MNLGLAAATFALIIPAELPDKTFISTIVLSSRHKGLPVWIGASAGLVLQAAIAVVAGRLLALLPHRVVELIVGVLFLAGAAYLFASRDAPADEDGENAMKQVDRPLRVALTTFSVVALAEFGDLSQVIIANLSAKYEDALSVFAGAAVGFLVISAAGVVLGRTLTRYVPVSLVRAISGLSLVGLGIWSLVSAW